MEHLLDILETNREILYFVYGQVFFTMGVIVLFCTRKHSRLPLARHLKWLAAFGLVHGLVEWSHIFIPIQATYVSNDTVLLLRDAHTLMLALSFYLLLQFGILVSFPASGRRLLLYSLSIGIPLVWLAAGPVIHAVATQTSPLMAPLVPKTEAYTRVILGFAGGSMAAFGLYRQARLLRQTGWPSIARYFRWAAVCMAVYGVAAGLVVPRGLGSISDLGNILFLPNVPILPGPLLRSIVGVGMAFGIVRGLGIFELETERMLQEAERSRFQAVERARLSLDAVSEALGHGMPKESLLRVALERVLVILGDPIGWVMLLRADNGQPEVWAISGLGEAVLPRLSCPGVEGCACKRVISGAEAGRVFGSSHCTLLDEAGTDCTFVSVPLKARDRVLGIMNVADRKFNPEEIGLLDSIGKQIGLALENADLWEELRRKEEVRAQLLARVISAQEDERKRIARELHDETGQKLSAVIIGLGTAAHAISRDAPRAAGVLTDTREIAVGALEGIRQLILGLRPAILDDLGLAPALRRIAEDFSRLSSMQIEVIANGLERSLAPAEEVVLFRILQEGMNNAVRHSGGHRVVVQLSSTGSAVLALVEDDGTGFDYASVTVHTESGRGLGLIGMQERASLLGGEVNVDSAPGRGTRLHVRLPLPNRGIR